MDRGAWRATVCGVTESDMTQVTEYRDYIDAFLFYFFFDYMDYHRTLNIFPVLYSGFSDSSVGKESACSAGDPALIPHGEDCWRRNRLPTPVFLDLPGGSDGKKSVCLSILYIIVCIC